MTAILRATWSECMNGPGPGEQVGQRLFKGRQTAVRRQRVATVVATTFREHLSVNRARYKNPAAVRR